MFYEITKLFALAMGLWPLVGREWEEELGGKRERERAGPTFRWVPLVLSGTVTPFSYILLLKLDMKWDGVHVFLPSFVSPSLGKRESEFASVRV